MMKAVTGSGAALPRRLVIATRESALAMWQARHIQAELAKLYPSATVTLLGMTTEGDQTLGVSLAKIGGKGLFVKELEDALARGDADLAVHSAKDVPARLPDGYVIAAFTERADPRDAFVSNRFASLDALPAGARIGTSSLRRESQLRARYRELRIQPLRGNVPTRLRKLDEGEHDAIVLAAAGLKRLGQAHRITALLAPEVSLPAVGQGALAIECRADRADMLSVLAPLNHAETAACVRAERALSLELAGTCNVPLGGYAEVVAGELRLRGYVGTPDGTQTLYEALVGPVSEPEALGGRLAAALKARGAAALLAALES